MAGKVDKRDETPAGCPVSRSRGCRAHDARGRSPARARRTVSAARVDRSDALPDVRPGAAAPLARLHGRWPPISTGSAPSSTTAARASGSSCRRQPARRAASRKAPKAYDLLYPLLDLTTTLDPLFNVRLSVRRDLPGRAVSGRRRAGRTSRSPCSKRVWQVEPDNWEYMQDIGFVHYWWDHDYQAAGTWFARAADAPGAPWWLRSLAAMTLAEGGRPPVVAPDVAVDRAVRDR